MLTILSEFIREVEVEEVLRAKAYLCFVRKCIKVLNGATNNYLV